MTTESRISETLEELRSSVVMKIQFKRWIATNKDEDISTNGHDVLDVWAELAHLAQRGYPQQPPKPANGWTIQTEIDALEIARVWLEANVPASSDAAEESEYKPTAEESTAILKLLKEGLSNAQIQTATHASSDNVRQVKRRWLASKKPKT